MIFTNYYQKLAPMYKIRNTGTGNGMRGMGRMLYSGECRQTFQGMSSNIPGNFVQHSGEFRQTFRGISPNIPLVVIGLGVTGPREARFVYLLDLFGEGGERVAGFRVYEVLGRSTTHIYHVYY